MDPIDDDTVQDAPFIGKNNHYSLDFNNSIPIQIISSHFPLSSESSNINIFQEEVNKWKEMMIKQLNGYIVPSNISPFFSFLQPNQESKIIHSKNIFISAPQILEIESLVRKKLNIDAQTFFEDPILLPPVFTKRRIQMLQVVSPMPRWFSWSLLSFPRPEMYSDFKSFSNSVSSWYEICAGIILNYIKEFSEIKSQIFGSFRVSRSDSSNLVSESFSSSPSSSSLFPSVLEYSPSPDEHSIIDNLSPTDDLYKMHIAQKSVNNDINLTTDNNTDPTTDNTNTDNNTDSPTDNNNTDSTTDNNNTENNTDSPTDNNTDSTTDNNNTDSPTDNNTDSATNNSDSNTDNNLDNTNDKQINPTMASSHFSPFFSQDESLSFPEVSILPIKAAVTSQKKVSKSMGNIKLPMNYQSINSDSELQNIKSENPLLKEVKQTREIRALNYSPGFQDYYGQPVHFSFHCSAFRDLGLSPYVSNSGFDDNDGSLPDEKGEKLEDKFNSYEKLSPPSMSKLFQENIKYLLLELMNSVSIPSIDGNVTSSSYITYNLQTFSEPLPFHELPFTSQEEIFRQTYEILPVEKIMMLLDLEPHYLSSYQKHLIFQWTNESLKNKFKNFYTQKLNLPFESLHTFHHLLIICSEFTNINLDMIDPHLQYINSVQKSFHYFEYALFLTSNSQGHQKLRATAKKNHIYETINDYIADYITDYLSSTNIDTTTTTNPDIHLNSLDSNLPDVLIVLHRLFFMVHFWDTLQKILDNRETKKLLDLIKKISETQFSILSKYLKFKPQEQMLQIMNNPIEFDKCAPIFSAIILIASQLSSHHQDIEIFLSDIQGNSLEYVEKLSDSAPNYINHFTYSVVTSKICSYHFLKQLPNYQDQFSTHTLPTGFINFLYSLLTVRSDILDVSLLTQSRWLSSLISKFNIEPTTASQKLMRNLMRYVFRLRFENPRMKPTAQFQKDISILVALVFSNIQFVQHQYHLRIKYSYSYIPKAAPDNNPDNNTKSDINEDNNKNNDNDEDKVNNDDNKSNKSKNSSIPKRPLRHVLDPDSYATTMWGSVTQEEVTEKLVEYQKFAFLRYALQALAALMSEIQSVHFLFKFPFLSYLTHENEKVASAGWLIIENALTMNISYVQTILHNEKFRAEVTTALQMIKSQLNYSPRIFIHLINIMALMIRMTTPPDSVDEKLGMIFNLTPKPPEVLEMIALLTEVDINLMKEFNKIQKISATKNDWVIQRKSIILKRFDITVNTRAGLKAILTNPKQGQSSTLPTKMPQKGKK